MQAVKITSRFVIYKNISEKQFKSVVWMFLKITSSITHYSSFWFSELVTSTNAKAQTCWFALHQIISVYSLQIK